MFKGFKQKYPAVTFELYAGDTIWCPPDVKHWHGASPEGEMIHIALTEVRSGKNVTWMEPVTDEQYYAK